MYSPFATITTTERRLQSFFAIVVAIYAPNATDIFIFTAKRVTIKDRYEFFTLISIISINVSFDLIKIFKEEEEAIKVDLHEGCGRTKLFWVMALADNQWSEICGHKHYRYLSILWNDWQYWAFGHWKRMQ